MSDQGVEILLVEDNQDDAELAIRALKQNNIANAVERVADGEEALSFIFGNAEEDEALRHAPRLVLLDLKLPKVSGIEVLSRLKSDPRTRRIPVIILSTSDTEPDLSRAYDLGVNSYLVKPVDFDQFVEVVRNLGFYWLLLNRSPDS